MKINDIEFLNRVETQLLKNMALEILRKQPNSEISQEIKKMVREHKWKKTISNYLEVSNERYKKIYDRK